jgi:hypothetical protein
MRLYFSFGIIFVYALSSFTRRYLISMVGWVSQFVVLLFLVSAAGRLCEFDVLFASLYFPFTMCISRLQPRCLDAVICDWPEYQTGENSYLFSTGRRWPKTRFICIKLH